MTRFVKNKDYGFIEVQPKPSNEELREYYEKKYYQEDLSSHAQSYSEEEVKYFTNKIKQKEFIIGQALKTKEASSLLDIGCGEGFALNYFKNNGWDVTGVDYSVSGLKQHHPHLVEDLIQGNIFEIIQKLVQQGSRYDVVWLDNVLEHVIDPENMLELCSQLSKDNGVLVIEVPNDYSDLQEELISSGRIHNKYWEAYPDHLSYFSRNSLVNLCEAKGWISHKLISDFPIEWFITNEHANYVANRDRGKAAHSSRIFIENFLNRGGDTSMQNLIDLYEVMCKNGQGRNICGIFAKD